MIRYLVPKEYQDRPLLRISYFMVKNTLGNLIRAIWVKKVEGLHNIPADGPVIFAFNHQSYFDFLCFIAVCPRPVHYLAAEKFFSHFFWAPLMRATGQIRVNRTVRDKRELHNFIFNHLNGGKAVGIFPEGTRSPHRHEMLYAFTGVAKYATKARVPVVPVGIMGTYDVMAKHHKKPAFKKLVTIKIGRPIEFSRYHGIKLNRKAYRVLTDIVMRHISTLSEKKYLHYQRFK